MSERPSCPSCGDELPADFTRQLCPRCLFRMAMESDSKGSSRHGAASAPTAPVGNVLDSIAASTGTLPRVLLRDTDGGMEFPIYRPGGSGEPEPGTRYRIDGEIAQGGMGTVLRGRDPDLGRDVALKVLRHDLRNNAEMVRRFVEEAQIGGQLQHPGIVPIYEMGVFNDRRPYFAMKLVKGRTLSSLLDERQPSTPSDRGIESLDRGREGPLGSRLESGRDLPRFVSIFEAVCQTIAYAHARGVIHRDLKPSNIMVGSFGEVQVMDWGLAKVLPQGGAAHDASAGKSRAQETVIATARSDSDTESELSKAGSVMGTPSYMAPEQARGEIDRLDERCDVFALGSILCELLTGEPAFTGRSSGEIQRKAARGVLDDAIGRLNSCEADVELIALAKDCLASELEDRPRHASEVAARINAYQTGVQERLKQAEIDRAQEAARAQEATKRFRVERDRLRLTVALAASVLALVILGGAGAFEMYRRQQQRLTAAETVVARVEILHEQARTQGANPAAWQEARVAADQALATIGDLALSPPGRRLAVLRAAIVAEEQQAESERRLLSDLAHFRASRTYTRIDDGYIDAFRKYGLELETTPFEGVVARLKSLPEAYQRQVVEFLDDWAIVRMERAAWNATIDYQHAVARPLAVARALDSDPYRNQLRTLLEQPDLTGQRPRLVALAKGPRAAEFGPSTSLLLAAALEKAGDKQTEIDVLRAAVVRHPGDLWVNFELATRLSSADPPQAVEAIRYYSIVRALRPETGDELSDLLFKQGQEDEAEVIRRELVRLEPDNQYLLVELAKLLVRRGKRGDADLVLATNSRRWQAKIDDPVAHFKLGLTYRILHDRTRELAELREAARLGPDNPDFHHELGHALIREGDPAGAIEAYRNALQAFPKDINCHYELAFARCLAGDHSGEVESIREAIRLESTLINGVPFRQPGPPTETYDRWDGHFLTDNTNFWSDFSNDFDQDHLALANALEESGDRRGAIAEYREAIRLGESDCLTHYRFLCSSSSWTEDEGISRPHRYLGMALFRAGDLPAAIAEFHEAIRIAPELVSTDVGLNLCLALARSGDVNGAVTVIRQAIQYEPSHRLNPVSFLGAIVVMDHGEESIRTLRRIRERTGDDRAVHDWIDRAIALTERVAALGPRMPRIPHVVSRSKDFYADACRRRRFFTASVALWSAAFAVEPTLAEDLNKEYRYRAACAAAMAGCGRGKDYPPPDETAKDKLRRQSLEWLNVDLASLSKLVEVAKPEDRLRAVQTLRGWKDDPQLAGVRDPANLEKFPETERKEWQTLWSDVEALLIRANRKSP